MRGRSPRAVCISSTTGSITASAPSGWCTTRSGPSATISSWSSVTRVAISTITSLAGSRPVISRSIHTSTTARLGVPPGGCAPGPAGEHNVGVLRIPVTRLDPDLPLPGYAHLGDAGADLRARHDVVLRRGGGRAAVDTGLALALPDGYVGLVM